MLFFNILSLYFNTLFNWYINLTIDGTIYPSQHFPFGGAFVCQAGKFWTLLRIKWVQVFPGGKATGCLRWPPTPSNAQIKERVEQYLYSPLLAFKSFLSLNIIWQLFFFKLQMIVPLTAELYISYKRLSAFVTSGNLNNDF